MIIDVDQALNYGLAPKMGRIFRLEWMYWGGGAFTSFLVANILISGSVFPSLSIPFVYKGDSLFQSWMIQRVMEGWIFDNARSGYPFGSLFLDYPGSDSANHFLLKLLGLAGGGFQVAMNLYFLIGFIVTFVVSYFVLRKLGLSIIFALTGSFVFDFLPFHFLRLEHLFYTWYFSVPIFFYLGFIYFECSKAKPISISSWRKHLLILLALVVVASFGVYNALFGVIVLSVSGVAGAVAHKNYRSIWWAGTCVVMITGGVLLNLMPNIVYRDINGVNPEVALRMPAASEVYGLKLVQLVLPRPEHRNERLAAINAKYSQSAPLVNENVTAALGIIGSVGLLVLFSTMLARVAGGRGDDQLALLALIVLILFLFGTIGGLGALFANVVSPAIRGWNRISVFIGFGAIAGFFIWLQAVARHCFSHRRYKVVQAVAALALVVLAFYDQTAPACLPCNAQTRSNFENDRAFVQAIEKLLPPGAAVYQLPYMPFPEVPPQNHLPDYGLTIGFLHSKALHWSYGGMKGGTGDIFFRGLAQEPIRRQLGIIRKLGFSGIYIDRRGYPDNGAEIVTQISTVLGYGPSLEDAAHRLVFFAVQGSARVQLDGLSAAEIMHKVGYISDRLGKRHPASLSDGIDFTLSTWPEFVRDVRGISNAEPWGRWSDANLSRIVRFEFFSPLPTKFTLVLSAKPFSRDGEQVVVIRIGRQTHRLVLRRGDSEVRLPIVLSNNRVDAIEFIPQNPISPQELGLGDDPRELGIGFFYLRFES